MKDQLLTGVSPEQLEGAVGALHTVIGNPKVADAMNAIVVDERRWREMVGQDASDLFRSAGVDIPPEVTVSLGDRMPDIPWPRPEVDLDLVVVKTFWWCYRSDDGTGPRTCTLVSLQVPKAFARKGG
jgi:hypothetical protein